MKATHFPKKHPGLPYREKGDQVLTFGVHQANHPHPPLPEDDAETEENLQENVEVQPFAAENVAQQPLDPANEIVTNKDLLEAIMGMKKMMVEKTKEADYLKQTKMKLITRKKSS